MMVDLKFDEKSLDFANLDKTEEKLTMKELVDYYDEQTMSGGTAKNTRKITKVKKGRGLTPKSSQLPKQRSPKLYNIIEQIIINKLKSLSSKEFENINIMPLDDAHIVFTTKIVNSLTRKRAKSNPTPKISKQGKTLSKRSKSLESIIKSNTSIPYNFNTNYSFINPTNMNIQNKIYIDIVRRRHNKIHENHKKILAIMDLNGIKLKEKKPSNPKIFSRTLKKKSISKSSSPTSIMML
jgi:hypothetical protein